MTNAITEITLNNNLLSIDIKGGIKHGNID